MDTPPGRSTPAVQFASRQDPGVQTSHTSVPLSRWLIWFSLLAGELWVTYKIYTQWVRLPLGHLHGTLELFDFTYYYLAAKALRLNPHANIYDPSVVAAVARADHLLIPPNPLGYPLLLPIVLIPLTVFSFQTAGHIWDLFDIALWIVNSWLLAGWLRVAVLGDTATARPTRALFSLPDLAPNLRHLIGRVWARWTRIPLAVHFALVVVAFLVFTSQPIYSALLLGQVSMLMLTCFLLVPWLVHRGHPQWAGVVIALVALIKVIPIVLLGYYLLRGRWRVVIGAAGTFAVCLVGITALVGVPNVLAMRQLISIATDNSGANFQNEAVLQIPLWIAAEFGGRPSSADTWLGLLLAVLFGAAFVMGVLSVARRAQGGAAVRHSPAAATYETLAQDWLGYCWALCTMVLVSPMTWGHHYIWLLGPFVAALGYALRRIGAGPKSEGGRIKPEVYLAVAMIVGIALTSAGLPFYFDGYTLFSVGPYWHGVPLRPLLMLVRPLGAILLWMAVGALYVRSQVFATGNVASRISDALSPLNASAVDGADMVEPSNVGAAVLVAAAPDSTAAPMIADCVMLAALVFTIAFCQATIYVMAHFGSILGVR